jgi:cytochrome c oxidase assembly factor CtaG
MLALGTAGQFSGLHLGEFLPPVLASALYLTCFTLRARKLRRQGRPVATWRRLAFLSGVVMVAVVQLPPLDTLSDQVLLPHMIQHIVIGDIASLLIALGLTGPVLQPLLRIRVTRPLRVLASPLVALPLWGIDLFGWHLPLLYQLAIRHDLVHAAEHACLLWFGTVLWLALIGPLPKPAWFTTGSRLLYVVAIRLIGTILGSVFIWIQGIVYPVYTASDHARGLDPLSDQNIAGGVMMIEQMLLTIVLLGWLFMRFAIDDEQRQALLDVATRRGVALSNERAARAAAAGRAEHLRRQLLETQPSPEQPLAPDHYPPSR